MADNEMISVIIPVYNAEKYLEKCIRSVVEQSYKNLEIILVNDGSTDHSGAICDKWAKKDKRIQVIHKANGGQSDARNAGLDVATGKYIGFVDSDDYIHPEMYISLYEKAKEYSADLIVCGFDRVDAQSDTIIVNENMSNEGIVDKKEALINICRKVSFVFVWNKLYKRELFHDIRFPKDKFAEDLFIMPELYDRCTKIVSIIEDLYYYVQTPNSICRRDRTVWHLDVVEAYYKLILLCHNNGYLDLQQEISAKMTDSYIYNMERIKRILPNEKHRSRKIKKWLFVVF